MTRRPSPVYRVALGLLILFLLLMSAPLTAQQTDCRLARPAIEQPWPGSGDRLARRYVWHALDAGSSIVASEAIHRTTKLSRMRSALLTPVLLSLIPHVAQLGRKRGPNWQPNQRDWAFDVAVRTLPLALASSHKLVALSQYAVTYSLLACGASP